MYQDGQTKMDRWDLVIVGGGPAGMAAGLVAAGNRLRTLILEGTHVLGGQIRNGDAPVIDVLGIPSENGNDLADRFASQVESANGLTIRRGERVESIDARSRPIQVRLSSSETVRAERLLIATGARARMLGVPGEDNIQPEGRAREIADQFSEKQVAVIGGGDEACSLARHLAIAGAHVTQIVRSTLRARPLFAQPTIESNRIRLLESTHIAHFERVGEQVQVHTGNGPPLEFDGVFIRIGVRPIWPQILPTPATSTEGLLAVDNVGRTSIQGIYAAGDICQPPKCRYVNVATRDGIVAARAVEEDGALE
jgi:thioredoxin reductase (NADPH)